jgi:hypothetical protein
MNKKQALIAIAVAALMSATTAMAQSTPAAPAAAPAAQSDNGKGSKPEGKFEDRKAKKLGYLEKAAAKIQQKQACVQASTDNKSLDACTPKRGKGKGGWHRHGGKGGAAKSGAGTAAPAAEAPTDQ